MQRSPSPVHHLNNNGSSSSSQLCPKSLLILVSEGVTEREMPYYLCVNVFWTDEEIHPNDVWDLEVILNDWPFLAVWVRWVFFSLYSEAHALHNKRTEMSLHLWNIKLWIYKSAQAVFNDGLEPLMLLQKMTHSSFKLKASSSLNLMTFLISEGPMMDKDSALYRALGSKFLTRQFAVLSLGCV